MNKKLFSCLCGLALLLLPGCSFASTNNPGTFYLPGTVPYDHDATNFIGRAGINPKGGEAKAVGRLIYDLKQANLWTNLDALYPFVGSSSNSCAQNLMSTNWPVAWHGGVSFDASGAHGNGIDGYGDTGYIQSSRGALTNNFHLYAWAVPVTNGALIAANGGTFGGLGSTNYTGTNRFVGYPLGDVFTPIILGTTGNAISIRLNASYLMLTDGIYVTNSDSVFVASTNSVKILGGISTGGAAGALDGYSPGTIRAASFGSSLNYNQATNYFGIMTRFHNALNRTPQILTP